MSEISSPKRLVVCAKTRPRLPRSIKLRYDATRARWVILAPERVFDPDETAVEVLKLCNGQTSVEDIASKLGGVYQAPPDEICDDILAMLQELADKGVIAS